LQGQYQNSTIMTKLFIIGWALLLTGFAATAQTKKPVADSTVSTDSIIVSPSEDGLKFSSSLRPLLQIAGAPEPFYTYFWEFGDGSFSFEKEPTHSFLNNAEYQVRLIATNHYDDGKRPPVKSRPVRGAKSKKSALASVSPKNFFTENQQLFIRNNADPKPGEDMVCVLGYKFDNSLSMGDSLKGTLALFFNEKEFKSDNFALTDVRQYSNEKTAEEKELVAVAESRLVYEPGWQLMASRGPLGQVLEETGSYKRDETFTNLLKEKINLFKNIKVWKVASVAGQANNMFFQLQTTPEMIKDTNATVVVTAVFIPDDPTLGAEITDLEMQIVASHDPNKMKASRNLLNYRWVSKNRKMKYTVHFQNTGKGPARRIELQTQIPPYINPQTIRVIDQYPACPPCAVAQPGRSCLDTIFRKDTAFFIFNNIYLPGTTQEGINDTDSTKGFVQFEANFIQKVPKKSFTGRTAIIFDKNPPIITNVSRTRFAPGLSPGIIAGYYTNNLNADKILSQTVKKIQGKHQAVLGASLSVYSSYKPYLQGEFFLRYQPQQSITGTNTKPTNDFILYNGRDYRVLEQRSEVQVHALYNDIAGLVRYSINNYVGIETGIMASYLVSGNTKEQYAYVLQGANGTTNIRFDSLVTTAKQSFTNIQPALIGGLYLGRVRSGPSIGLRYLHYLQQPYSRFFIYATWKL
jgi:hypothetical protein